MTEHTVDVLIRAREKDKMSEQGYDLSAHPQLYPVLLDEKGKEVIDGEHRLKANPKWKKIKVPGIRTEKDLLVARMVANLCRREISSEEKKHWINDLAKILQGEGYRAGGHPVRGLTGSHGIATQIARLTGLSRTTVCLYLADEFKGEAPKVRGKRIDDGGLRRSPKPPQKERPISETPVHQILRHKHVCPYCNKPARILLLWGCCLRRVAGGK